MLTNVNINMLYWSPGDEIVMTLDDPNICSGQYSSITTLSVRGSQVSGFGNRKFAATRTKVHKIIIPGY